jgi:hypothetical protein
MSKMDVGAPTVQESGGGAGAVVGGGAGLGVSQPGFWGYQDDTTFFNQVMGIGQPAVLPPSDPATTLASYIQYLPDLTRGHVAGNGYPADYDGFLLQDNFFPRIVGVQPGDPSLQPLLWSVPTIPGIDLPACPDGLTLAQFIVDPDTVQTGADSHGNPATWYNSRYNVYVSYKPHIVFNRLFQNQKIFADPSAYYWQSAYNAWSEPSYALSIERFVGALCLVYGAAIAAGAAVGTAGGSAGTGATAAATDVGTTTVQATSITVEDVSTIAPSVGGDLSSLPALDTVTAADASAGTAVGAGTALEPTVVTAGAAPALESVSPLVTAPAADLSSLAAVGAPVADITSIAGTGVTTLSTAAGAAKALTGGGGLSGTPAPVAPPAATPANGTGSASILLLALGALAAFFI